jgi:PIN domain nuclease of toxin-antitoxin system
VILLDTNAIIWIVRHHRRTRGLVRHPSLRISPSSILELQLLAEVGSVRLDIRNVLADERWCVDEPPSVDWFTKAAEESWTRDPFDRLIVAHARLRGWKLATGDGGILDHLRPSERVEL